MMNMMNRAILAASMLAISWSLNGCATAPRTQAEREIMEEDVRLAVDDFIRQDPGMEQLFEESYGFVVFPNVTQGAVGVGGAHGWGIVYEQGQPIGYAELTQGTIGAQLGGEEYRQVILFEHESALRRFTRGQTAFAARAGATAASRGASADANFSEGVMVFTMRRGGAMFQAAVGGQNFEFFPFENGMAGAGARPAQTPQQ